MVLIDMMQAVLEHSGLLPLWHTLAPWLALDERQLIFVVATPVFIAVTLWEYGKIRHDPRRMDPREAVRNFALGAGYQLTELLFAGVLVFCSSQQRHLLHWHKMSAIERICLRQEISHHSSVHSACDRGRWSQLLAGAVARMMELRMVTLTATEVLKMWHQRRG